MKSWKVEAAIIAVGLLLLGIMVKGGINNFVNKDRVVSERAGRNGSACRQGSLASCLQRHR